jgi:hypothetical protein
MTADHNAKVRAFAERMPTGPLANAIRAIGYRAGWKTGITNGFTVAKLAELSGELADGAYKISRPVLADAIAVLRDNNVLAVMAGKEQAEDGTWQNKRNRYAINYGWQGDTGKLRSDLMGKRQRRQERQRAKTLDGGKAQTPTKTAEDAERMASLTQWDSETPGNHDPLVPE